MAKYTGNKQIDLKRSNDMEDLKDIGKTNVTSKFTPKVKPVINDNNTNKNKIVSANIKKLSPPIPIKSPKKVKEISKFFKNLKLVPVNNPLTKSYAQVSKSVNYTEEVIKIKDTFLSFKVSKINQVQKIIKGKALVSK
ncbi:hypothetical protein Ac2012v2_005302 [Leucoagaricus gongylophorus]